MLPRPLDWSLMVPARPPTPCKSTKSRLPDTEITKGRRSLHLKLVWDDTIATSSDEFQYLTTGILCEGRRKIIMNCTICIEFSHRRTLSTILLTSSFLLNAWRLPSPFHRGFSPGLRTQSVQWKNSDYLLFLHQVHQPKFVEAKLSKPSILFYYIFLF